MFARDFLFLLSSPPSSLYPMIERVLRSHGKRAARARLAFGLALLLLASIATTLCAAAQAPATNVGSTSATQTATVTITTAGTLSKIAVLTQGATGLDYKAVIPNAAGTPCTTGTTYNVGDTCKIQYTFSPTHPWIRYGGISLADAFGKPLGNVYLTGKGMGPPAQLSP